jgi:ankyrin repeat protein
MGFHTSVLSLRKKLGYHGTKEGCCHGVTMRWIEACLLNEEKIFDTRIRKINDEGKSLVEKIDEVKLKAREHQELTQEDKELLDILAFYESLELYQMPSKFSDTFNVDEAYSQHDAAAISNIAASDQIKERGSLAVIYSEPGIYTADEISMYLDELANTINESGNTNDIFGVLLHNVNHAIGLTYQPRKEWRFMDINQYPPRLFQKSQDVVSMIAKGFANNSPYFAFNTSMIVTGDHAKQLDSLREQLDIVKNSHVITKEIAQREENINLIHLAAEYGDANLILDLAKAGADLNKQNTNGPGATPVFIAAQAGHANVITALAEADADINKGYKGGVTPAIVAAHAGHARAITALAKAGADLDQEAHNGATPLAMAIQSRHDNAITALLDGGADINKITNVGTPLFIAAKKGYTDMVDLLLAYKANANIPYVTSADKLRAMVAKRSELTQSRMNTIIQRQLDAGEKEDAISIKPYDIAWIMEREEICTLLHDAAQVSATGMFASHEIRNVNTMEEKDTRYVPKK